MRNTRKGFTLIELLIVVVIVGILALAAIPLITSNTQDARMAEGRQMLGTMRNQARVQYSKTAAAPADLAACGVTANQRVGEYYTVGNTVAGATTVSGTAYEASLAATATGDPTITLGFNYSDGSSGFDPAN